jgi:hypothetical protein
MLVNQIPLRAKHINKYISSLPKVEDQSHL